VGGAEVFVRTSARNYTECIISDELRSAAVARWEGLAPAIILDEVSNYTGRSTNILFNI